MPECVVDVPAEPPMTRTFLSLSFWVCLTWSDIVAVVGCSRSFSRIVLMQFYGFRLVWLRKGECAVSQWLYIFLVPDHSSRKRRYRPLQNRAASDDATLMTNSTTRGGNCMPYANTALIGSTRRFIDREACLEQRCKGTTRNGQCNASRIARSMK